MYTQGGETLLVDFQYHRSSCHVTYQNAHFIAKDAKLSRRYTKLGNKIMFWW